MGGLSCVGGLGITFHTCFSLVHCRAVIFRAWLYLISSLQEKKQTPPTQFFHMQVCASLEKLYKRLEAVHTSFAGAWHAHLCDGGDDGVVPVAFANQVNYPVCDLFNGAPVQAMVLSRLEVARRK